MWTLSAFQISRRLISARKLYLYFYRQDGLVQLTLLSERVHVHITIPSSLTSCFILLDLCLLCFLFNFTSQLGTNVLPGVSCCPHQFVYLFPQFVLVLCYGLPHSSCMCVSELCFSFVFSFLAPGCPIFCTVLGFSIDVAFFLTIFCLETNRQSVKTVKESWWLHS